MHKSKNVESLTDESDFTSSQSFNMLVLEYLNLASAVSAPIDAQEPI